MSMDGFDFSHTRKHLHALRGATKTGTTICGVVFDGGVVLGADTRSTNGDTVADKNCEKIHKIASNIFCCGAGTAADTESITGTIKTIFFCLLVNITKGLISSQLHLHSAQTGRMSLVTSALTLLKSTLFRYQGHIGAALVLGGVDKSGSHLFTVYPHGSSDALPYAAMGSGSLAAISTLETGYTEKLTMESAKVLVVRSILAGIQNDLGSGSSVDLCVITSTGTTYLRNHTSNMHRTFQLESNSHVSLDSAATDAANFATATRTIGSQ